eukprot:215973-Hanusia_phi.AAC.1
MEMVEKMVTVTVMMMMMVTVTVMEMEMMMVVEMVMVVEIEIEMTWPMTIEKLRQCDEKIDMELVELPHDDSSIRSSSSSNHSNHMSAADSQAFGT